MARKISNLSASYTRLWLVKFYTLFRIQGLSRYLEKRRSSMNLDIHHSKVLSSERTTISSTYVHCTPLWIEHVLFKWKLCRGYEIPERGLWNPQMSRILEPEKTYSTFIIIIYHVFTTRINTCTFRVQS